VRPAGRPGKDNNYILASPMTASPAYDASLWRGNRFNTLVHRLFTALWTYLVGAYAGALFLGG